MKNELAIALLQYKKKYKLTYYELAEGLGISYSTIHNWIKGTKKPSLDAACRVGKYSRNEIKFKILGYE